MCEEIVSERVKLYFQLKSFQMDKFFQLADNIDRFRSYPLYGCARRFFLIKIRKMY